MNASYCVVGGGISGLAAAHRLRAQLGEAADITLFEPSQRLGGVLRTANVGGAAMDVGAEAFLARRPEMPALLAELGLAERTRTPTGVSPLLYCQRRLHRLPTGTLNGIPSSAESLRGLVDAQTIARIAAEPSRPLAFEPGSDPALGALVGDRFGEQVVACSVDPLIGGVYAGSANSVGLRSAVPALAAALDDGATSLTEAVQRALPEPTGAPVFGALAGGYQVLIDALLRSARPQWIQSAVRQIDLTANGWSLWDDSGRRYRADRIVLAIPAAMLARLATAFAPRAAAAASRIVSASSVVVAMALPAGVTLPNNSGVLVATGERLHCKAITLTSRKWGVWGEGKAELVRLSFGRLGDSRIGSPDPELLSWAMHDLHSLFGVWVNPIDAQVQRWPAAMPQYRSGHLGLVAALRAGLPPSMAVAGNYLDGIGVPACLASADRAVARLLEAGAPE